VRPDEGLTWDSSRVGKLERQMVDGEQVVVDVHPHWRRLVLPMLVVPIVIGVAAFAIGIGPGGPAYDWSIVGVAVLLLAWFSFLPWLRWQTTRYVVTNRQLIYRHGIITQTGRDVPLYRLNDVHFENTIADRITGSGDLILESAGEQGQLRFTDVPRVDEVQRTINRLREEDDQRRRRGL
jgi:membrane protein YdbS with pleckstrin-like domain